MTKNRIARLQFINDNLEWGDNKLIAASVNNNSKSSKSKPITSAMVSDVRKGKWYSKRIFDAAEAQAIENKKQILAINELVNKTEKV